MNKLYIYLFLFILISCHTNSNLKKRTTYSDENYILNWMNNPPNNNLKNILCSRNYLNFWKKNLHNETTSFYGLDSVDMLSVQKFIGNSNETLCVILDSSKILDVSYIDKKRLNINHLERKDINGLNCFLLYLLTPKEEADSIKAVSMLDSIQKLYSNFYIKYTLYQSLPKYDSIRKLNIAYELWNDTNTIKKKIFNSELLKIFSYINKHSLYKKSSLEFENTIKDLGNLSLGSEKSIEFIFKNVGKKPVILTKVETSCGCIVASYPHFPIKPGYRDKIKIHFKGISSGTKYKTITVRAIGEQPIVLAIKANVTVSL